MSNMPHGIWIWKVTGTHRWAELPPGALFKGLRQMKVPWVGASGKVEKNRCEKWARTGNAAGLINYVAVKKKRRTFNWSLSKQPEGRYNTEVNTPSSELGRIQQELTSCLDSVLLSDIWVLTCKGQTDVHLPAIGTWDCLFTENKTFYHDKLFITCFCCLNSLQYHQREPGRAQISCMTALSSGVTY